MLAFQQLFTLFKFPLEKTSKELMTSTQVELVLFFPDWRSSFLARCTSKITLTTSRWRRRRTFFWIRHRRRGENKLECLLPAHSFKLVLLCEWGQTPTLKVWAISAAPLVYTLAERKYYACKHSSLFWPTVSDEAKTFYTIATRSADSPWKAVSFFSIVLSPKWNGRSILHFYSSDKNWKANFFPYGFVRPLRRV